MKLLLLISSFLFLASSLLYSQSLMVENFNFNARDSLEGIGGWDDSGPVTPNNITVVSPGLTYPGYLCSGIGNTSYISNAAQGDVCLRRFGMITSGTVYIAFMLRIEALSPTATEAYNICLDQEGGTTNHNTKIYAKRVSSGTFNLGIRKISGAPKYAPGVYSINTTYLVIASYTFRPGTSDDICKLYVGASGIPATEPASPLASDTVGVDVFDIGEVALLNSTLQSGLIGCPVKIDGIRTGTSWNGTLFQNINMNFTLDALIQGFYDNSTNKMVKDTARVIMKFMQSPYTSADTAKAVLDSTGTGSFVFQKVGMQVPYYISVRHRNLIETWSNVPKEFNSSNTLSYDFTPHISYAYGNNQIQKGTKWCMYNGDINQDGAVELSDVVAVYNAATVFASGYIVTDVTGDNFVDVSDMVLTFNNAQNFVVSVKP